MHYDRGPGDFGKRVERGGKPQPRPKGNKPPCHWCPKVPPGDPPCPDSAVELSGKNALAYFHYLECKAVGEFPDDAIVRRNAGIIAGAEEVADRLHQTRVGLAMMKGIRQGM